MAEVMEDFPAVYRAHHGFVWHALHRFGLSSSSLEDAVQDVFIVAYRRRDGFEGASLKAWLYGIARRVASNYRRAGRRHDRRSEAYGATVSVPRQPIPEAIVALDDYLKRLPQEDRELFVLSEIEGLSGPELAAVGGRNLNTIYTRIRKLRRGLGAELPDPQRVRREQPRASAGSWGLLAPWLSDAPMGLATATGSASIAKWGLGLALGTAIAGVVGVTVVGSAQQTTRGPQPVQTPAAEVDLDVGPRPSAPPRVEAAVEVAAIPETTEAAGTPLIPAPVKAAPPLNPVSLPAASSTRTAGLSEENKLLRKASETLHAGDATEALQWTTEHHRRFPGSALADLRAAIRIEALCLSGNFRQAQAEGKLLMTRRPQSAAARRVRRALEKNCEPSQQKTPSADTTRP